MPNVPAYLRIAGDLRLRIASGDLSPGAKVPTETALMAQYGVSRTVAKYAINVLKDEGLVEGRRGSGVYVREIRRLIREGHSRDQRAQSGSTSPFARDAARAGHRGNWEHHSEHAAADPGVATRLGIEPGAPVMLTRYRFLADGEPIQLSTSYEPLALTGGTAVEWPENGTAVGVVARFDQLGIRIDQTVEKVSVRPAHPQEITDLNLSARGAQVIVIERTYFAGDTAAETADIILAADRYQVIYHVPVE